MDVTARQWEDHTSVSDWQFMGEHVGVPTTGVQSLRLLVKAHASDKVCVPLVFIPGNHWMSFSEILLSFGFGMKKGFVHVRVFLRSK